MSYKDEYAEQIESQFYDLESLIIADIIRRIRKTSKITSTADYQIGRLAALGYSSADIEDAIKSALGATYPQMFELYDEVACWEYVRNKKLYEQINAEFIPFEDNTWLQNLLRAVKQQTKGTLQNFTQTMGVVDNVNGQMSFLPLTQFYQKTLDAAVLDIASGAFDYNSVLKRTVATLSKSGIRTIDYASGYTSRLPVAVRRAVMTGVSQLTGKISEYNAKKLGTDYFEIDRHDGARPSHRPWQGKVWSRDELVSVCGLGTVTGLKGVNCYHEYYPFILGVSERNYTDEELKRLDALEDEKKPFKGKEYNSYEARQKQRQMETAMRAQRTKVRALEEGGADRDDIIIAKARYQGQIAEYKRFSSAMELKPHMERVYIDGLGRVAPGRGVKPITPKRRNVAKYDKLRYNKDGSLVVTNDWTGQKHPNVPKQFKPYAVIETMKHPDGQRDLTIFDADGWKSIELHSGDHNRAKQHPYGERGEHSHIYLWNKTTGERLLRETHELTETEKKWIGDRIWQQRSKR